MEQEFFDTAVVAVQAMDSLQIGQAISDSISSTRTLLDDTRSELTVTNNSVADTVFMINNVWMLIATALVFIMHLGFATLESGLTRAKNTTNILFKNTIIPAIGILTHLICGFSLMFPGFEPGVSLGIIDFAGWGLHMPEFGDTKEYNVGFTYYTDFLFQAMFAATSATIVSGAVAERVKLNSFMVFMLVFTGFIYPVIGSWSWGKGFLNTLGFTDFAGSTVVHSVGGWAALAGIIVIGPRMGKYEKGRIYPIPGHSMTSAVIGTFMLWLGWYGFNGGSVLSAEPSTLASVFLSTTLAAASGAIFAALTIVFISKNYDLSMVLNGILAGLVGITAGANVMGPYESVFIGAVSGILVVLSVLMFDRLKIDDPVGATSVHLVCGIWGTLAVGLLGKVASVDQFTHQLIGVGACGAASFTISLVVFYVIKLTLGVRVSKDEEIYGLDASEHGMEAYPNFMNK
jgi:Amt family ammonium transporter